MHIENPVPQTIHDQLQHTRMLHVQRVPGASVVRVVTRVVGRKPVVGAIVDALQRERGPKLIAFGSVVVDDIENHLETR